MQFQEVKKNPINFNGQENVGNGAGAYTRIYVYITKKEAEKMLDNTSEKCGNDPKFPGYDVVYFRNDGRRTKENAVGINFAKQKVNFNIE